MRGLEPAKARYPRRSTTKQIACTRTRRARCPCYSHRACTQCDVITVGCTASGVYPLWVSDASSTARPVRSMFPAPKKSTIVIAMCTNLHTDQFSLLLRFLGAYSLDIQPAHTHQGAGFPALPLRIFRNQDSSLRVPGLHSCLLWGEGEYSSHIY